MNNKTYCYIRISTEKQDGIRQENILKEKGYIDSINCEYITEIFTGKTTKRPIFQDLIKNKIQKGDTIVACELSRISRSVKDFNNLIDEIVEKKKVNIIILKENFNLLANGQMDAMTKLIMHITSAFAEFERDIISDRTKEALQAKKINGTKTGKPIGRVSGKYSTKENLINTLKMCMAGSSYEKSCLKTRYPLGTLRLKLKQYKDKYKVNTLKEIVEKLESEE